MGSSSKYSSNSRGIYGGVTGHHARALTEQFAENFDPHQHVIHNEAPDDATVDNCNRSDNGSLRGWDVFIVSPPPDEDETLNSKIFEFVLKFLKLLAYLFSFVIILGTAVISKGSILLMTSLIKPNRTGISVCNQGVPGLDRDKRYEAVFNTTDPERVAWMWSLFFILIVPELMTLFRSCRICTFKSYRRPTSNVFTMIFLTETLHSIGIVLLVFVILPSLDVVKGAMLTNCLCFMPALLSLLSRNSGESKRVLKIFLDFLSLLSQFSAFIIWPLTTHQESDVASLIPVAAILVSIGWWENYVSKNSPFKFVRNLAAVKANLHRSRYFAFIFISCWKVLVFFLGLLTTRFFIDGNMSFLFTGFKSAFSVHKVLIVRDRSDLTILASHDHHVGIEGEWVEMDSYASTPIWVTLLSITASWLCYVVGKFACKIMIQGFSFAFPLSLTVPTSISLLIASCGIYFDDSCNLSSLLPRYIFWTCPSEPFSGSDTSGFFNLHALMWLLWLLSQTWITIHVWIPKCERLAATEKLFVNPMYCSVLIDQSLAMNRRRDDEEMIKSEDINLENDGINSHETTASQHYETISEHPDDKKSTTGSTTANSQDQITKIYACATMWHETPEEMIQVLKSCMRMDEDQSARRNAQKYLRIVDPDYYEFEVNIFFDDAFQLNDTDEETVINKFVQLLVEVIDTAASNAHQCNIRLKPPKKYPTPYGGKLEWTLPGGNRLSAHLKDKMKIRHRKRWSQVMYMYYLLGHRLMELPIDVSRKAVMAENTYILTLDGDINFRPHAVQLLVDLMKKNKNLGAACGRIHPIGSGLMAWYQKFEYAVGHWLQKATEHMIGCVLCSPGCFSLFRAKALMDDNVMRKYTTRSDEAIHYVQFDQGEDRWLCTLLLQRGYRVEYSAASDAYTHCPEGFSEFYTQRRRWAPSTMANIMDLLGDYKRTIAINDHISFPYIVYQGMLMVGTILGPGTIFLMLVGALVAVFRISNFDSFIFNLIPILVFIIVCFTCKNETQILVAQIMSAAYALLMMAVFVGTAIQMTEDGLTSPSAIFSCALSGSFVVAALLHPQEFSCLTPVFLYLLSIPCMYLLLIIYSLINLNVVTWGTREVETKKSQKEVQEEKRAEEEMKKRSIISFLDSNPDKKPQEGSIVFSLANLFKCMLCTYDKPNEEAIHLIKIEDHLKQLNNKVTVLERAFDPQGRRRSSSQSVVLGKHGTSRHFSDNLSCVTENEEEDIASLNSEGRNLLRDDDNDSLNSEGRVKIKREDLLNPYWIEDKKLRGGEIAYLHPQELAFWKELIDKYLYPIDQDKNQERKVAADLIELRNRVVFAFFMLNALFVLVVLLLQLNKDVLHVDWPFGVRENITFVPETNEIRIEKEYLEMEPIGLVFVVFFGLILVIQLIGMLFHRFGTLSHMLASVDLNFCSQKVEDINDDDFLDKNAIKIALQLQRLRGIDDDDKTSDDTYGNRVDRRKTIQNLAKRQQQKTRTGTLDVAFRRRFMKISSANNEQATPILGGVRRKETLNALQKRCNTFINANNGVANGDHMRTLGSKNEFVRSQARSTLDTKGRNQSRRTILGQNGAFDNQGFSGPQAGNSSNSSLEDETAGLHRHHQMQEMTESVYSLGSSSRPRTTPKGSRGHISQM